MEALNITTGLPWLWTIVGGTVLWRIVLLPFHVIRLRQCSLWTHCESEMPPEILKERQQRLIGILEGKQSPSSLEHDGHLSKWFDKGLNPLVSSPGLLMFVVPMHGGLLGLLQMCQLPVAQLTQSGSSLFPDLTVTGSYWLAALAFILMQLQLMVSVNSPHSNNITC